MQVFVASLPYIFFFFNDTATTEIYTLSLHDALPISSSSTIWPRSRWPTTWWSSARGAVRPVVRLCSRGRCIIRSEEHTSELQSRQYLVCRLLLEKKKQITNYRREALRETDQYANEAA